MNNFFDFDCRIVKLLKECESNLFNRFDEIDEVLEYNSSKVLKAFIDNKISLSHFTYSTGYGYDDVGRDRIDSLYSQIFDCEDSLVRHNFVSGTHAISTALFGLLRPNDTLLSITGSPYDTLLDVIGINNFQSGSLKDFDVLYDEVNIFSKNFSKDVLLDKAKRAKVVYIQRSRGYSNRDSLTIDTMKEWIDFVKSAKKDIIVLVDNCYGEFVEKLEPTSIGADLIVGSLIKNPGGGIADTGGYIAGKKDLIELCSNSLTAPSLGKEVGCSLDQNKKILLGIYFAPSVVASAIKVAALASLFFERLGFETSTNSKKNTSDIITVINLKSKEGVLAFCKGIQHGSPVDSFATPLPWDMPGYDSQIIMAAGTFTQGASIELSADGPIKEPYNVFLQGGLSYHSSKIGLLNAAQFLLKENLIF